MAESDILVHLITENAPRRLSRTSSVSIELLPDGKCHVTTRVWGRADASYALVPDAELPGRLPFILAEMREELRLDRHLTVEESAALKAQFAASPGSTVTA